MKSTHRFLHITVAVACWAAASVVSLAQPAVSDVTRVTGLDTFFMPSVSLANLDAGNLVAGTTRWDHDGDGIIFNESHGGFLWSPNRGAAIFAVSDDLYFRRVSYFPTAIAPNRIVAGTAQFRDDFTNKPYVWTRAGGLQLLRLPRPALHPGSNWTGDAVAISDNGRVIVGSVRDGIFSDVPTFAARWIGLRRRPPAFGAPFGGGPIVVARGPRWRLNLLDTPDAWSNANDVSADGSVIVGDSGPSDSELAATRWVHGVMTPLDVVGSSSTALFTSTDGGAAIGTAAMAGQDVLVRWDQDGVAMVAAPPVGMTVEFVREVNATATAAVGALSVPDPTSPFGRNQSPFVWTMQDGFVVLPELGHEQELDLSDAVDVSDDGNRVVGVLQGSTAGGTVPQPAYLWTRAAGMLVLNNLLAASPFSESVFDVIAISGDGTRIVAIGDRESNQDTDGLIISFEDE